MEVTLTFKTPGVLDQLEGQVPDKDLDKARAICSKFLEYGEYLTIQLELTPPYTAVIKQLEK